MKIKKISRKKRNTIYIREKNHLRLGGVRVESFKTNIPVESNDFAESIENVIKSRIATLSRKFKIELDFFMVEWGWSGDDFARDMSSIRYKICNISQWEKETKVYHLNTTAPKQDKKQ